MGSALSAKIKICLDDPEVRAIWNTALRARREVASWPAWKRGGNAEETKTVMSEFSNGHRTQAINEFFAGLEIDFETAKLKIEPIDVKPCAKRLGNLSW